MEQREWHFQKDIQDIQSLEIVPSILELICRTTGMGFAAVARVTEDRWIACAVKDEINFGLKPGGELQIETTICNEIRGHGQPVVIDEVSKDEQYRDHHTPKMYGIQSYISIPIIRKDGTFFGTLCAIDPRPFSLRASNMVAMFNLYADLISYHLETQDRLRLKNDLLKQTEEKLQESLEDVRQYAYISRHNLQEPLRKLRLFSDLIIAKDTLPPDHNVKGLASKINELASEFSNMITHLTDFSATTHSLKDYQLVDLNETLRTVINRLQLKIKEKKAQVEYELLHVIPGIPQQLSQLFYYILDNALSFTHADILPVIKIYSRDLEEAELTAIKYASTHATYCKVCFQDNGIGIHKSHTDQIFDLFARLNPKEQFYGSGMGLSQSRKIIRNHEGTILVESEPGKGATFSLIFPLIKNNNMTQMVIASHIQKG